jgi:hypothetical protein
MRNAMTHQFRESHIDDSKKNQDEVNDTSYYYK